MDIKVKLYSSDLLGLIGFITVLTTFFCPPYLPIKPLDFNCKLEESGRLRVISDFWSRCPEKVKVISIVITRLVTRI